MSPQPSTLTVQTLSLGEADVVSPRGTIDYWSVAPFREELDRRLTAKKARVIVDFAEVPFCDSTGIGLLLEAQQRAEATGGWLRLLRPQLQMRRVLAVTRLDQRLPAYPTLDAALNGRHEG